MDASASIRFARRSSTYFDCARLGLGRMPRICGYSRRLVSDTGWAT